MKTRNRFLVTGALVILFLANLSIPFIGAVLAQSPAAPAPAPATTELEQVKAERDALRKYIKDYQAWIIKAYQLQITTINACIGQPPAEVPPTPPTPETKK